MNLSDFLTSEADALEREFRDVTATDRTPRSIRRVRAVRHGATAGVSVVAMGALVAGGVRLAGWEQEEPAGVPGEDGIITLDMADPSGFDPLATVPACGDLAPEVTGEIEGFTYINRGAQTVAMNPITSDRRGTVAGSVQSTRADAPTVSVSDIAFVWVQDGTVVAYSVSPYARVPQLNYGLREVAPGERFNVSGTLWSRTFRCDSPANGPWTTVGAGTYEVYPVVRVVGSADVAAWMALDRDGFVSTPGNNAWSELYPGSPYCVEEIAGRLDGVEYQGEDGEAAPLPSECSAEPDDPARPNVRDVNYLGSDFPAAVDATLVGEPIEVTVNTSWQEAADRRADASPPHPFPAPLQCGVEVPALARDSSDRLTLFVQSDVFPPSTGQAVQVRLNSSYVVSPTVATLPEEFEAYFLERIDDRDYSTTDPYRVVGRGTVHLTEDHEVTFTHNDTSVALPGAITAYDDCGIPEPNISNWVIETTVLWTDVNGTVEIEYPPR
jgi:hypothetical protein